METATVIVKKHNSQTTKPKNVKFHEQNMRVISINLVFKALAKLASNKDKKNGDELRLHNLIASQNVDMITYENNSI